MHGHYMRGLLPIPLTIGRPGATYTAMDKLIPKYSGCFVCGEQNHHGLQTNFYYNGTEAYADVTALPRYEGYKDIFHGGVMATLLDEVMLKAILALDKYCVPAEMTVRFVRPVMVGDQVRLVGRVTRQRGRVYITEGEAVGSDGQPYATATAKYIEADGNLKAALLQSLD